MTKITKISIIVLLLSSVIPAWGFQPSQRLDSLTRVLDATIAKKPLYYSQKRHRLDSLRSQLHNSIDLRDRFTILESLFDEYNSFSIDTAMIVATFARNTAQQIGDPEAIVKAKLMQAEGCKGLAKYIISLNMLDSIAGDVDEGMRRHLLSCYTSLYYSLKENTFPESESRRYADSLMHYRTLLLQADSFPTTQAINTIENLKDEGRHRQAIDTYHAFVASYPGIQPQDMAILQYVVAEAYDKAGSPDTAMQYLAQAAIFDIQSSDRKYNALPMLASMMYENGDIQHAYDYIMFSLNDIKASNAYNRMTRVLEALPIISNAYDMRRNQIVRKERTLHWVLYGCVALVLVMLAVIYVDNKRLGRDRKRLQVRNTALVDQNHAANEQNESLASAGRAREDYIGWLCRTCSEYINIMAQEHNSLMKIVKNGKMADIERMLAKMQDPERFGRFQKRFDLGFIDLFPDFIDSFNSMLAEEHRIVPPAGELTPELRIFALMRLGIADTAQIASFLNYSPQTVYNYRFKIHSHLIVEKEEFYDRISKI